MRLLLFILLLLSFSGFSQTSDTAFNSRLSSYMQANRELDFDKIISYIHPKLFELAPKDQMVESMRQAFENDEMKIELDSMNVDKVGVPFSHGKSLYRKIDYSMVMDLTMLGPDNTDDSLFVQMMNGVLGNSFNGTSVFDSQTKKFHVKGKNVMIAIKDRLKPWMFIGYKKDKKLLEFLLPRTVIQKFALR